MLQCARSRVEAERMTTICRLAGESLDWNVLLRFAFRHNLIPLLYANLKKFGAVARPAWAARLMHDHFVGNAVRTRLLTNHLRHLVTLFQRRGVKVVPFKGRCSPRWPLW